MKTGIELIAEERQEQIEKHGYDRQFIEDHPEYYDGGEIQFVANMLLSVDYEEGIDSDIFPLGWEDDCERMIAKPKLQRLIIAGALIAAEIDRLQDLTQPKKP